jgi:hypothetical protein
MTAPRTEASVVGAARDRRRTSDCVYVMRLGRVNLIERQRDHRASEAVSYARIPIAARYWLLFVVDGRVPRPSRQDAHVPGMSSASIALILGRFGVRPPR